MASNYTEHYQLPIWSPEDSFLREEFNESHQKIDAALGIMPYVRITNLKTETASTTVSLNVQALDFTKYLRVDLFLICEAGFNGDVELCLNGLTNDHCVHGSGSGGVSSGLPFYRSLGTFLNANGHVSFFAPRGGAKVGCAFSSCSAYKTEYQSGASWSCIVSQSTQVTWDTLTTFDFRSNQDIPAGTEVVLCGVKK